MAAKRKTKSRRGQRLGSNDTLISGTMLTAAVDAILKRTRLDRRHDVPYLAGYSSDGKTIFIDKDLPRSFLLRGKRVQIDRYLILHESIEKTLLDRLGLRYQHAHQIALRAEEAAVRAKGISWEAYDRFMQKYIKEADDNLERLPKNLDIKPYRDERDFKLLRRMQADLKSRRRKVKRNAR